ncbi:MAG: septal ring lytic transglycosylase RlpA family protein [Coriobacteriales bacterium]|nr:septal ring lytic transglycosylase RlpA family protein [Actinomycetes bacterium]
MSRNRTASCAIVLGTTLCLLLGPLAGASAAPVADVAADEAALERALARYDAALREARAIDAKVAAASAELDDLVAEQNAEQTRLEERAAAMYRWQDSGTLEFLLGARDMQQLADRLDLIERLAYQDAENIRRLKAARTAATESARQLLELQAQQARALDAAAAEITAARRELAASKAALAQYEARRKAADQAASATRGAVQKRSGTGAWKVAVASHYSRDFTGVGASGEKIGPYSMIVAHKTLPFGTLIEFEYNGKRAVAKVADRGPHVAGRTFDLGPGVVRVLDFSGVHEVRYRVIGR